jgi:hypothetical protein
MKSDFFLAYHYVDQMASRCIETGLKEECLSILLDPWEFLPGDNVAEKLRLTFYAFGGMSVFFPHRFLHSASHSFLRCHLRLGGINVMDQVELFFALHKNSTFVEKCDAILVVSRRCCKNMIGYLLFLHPVIYYQSNIGG